MSNDYYEEQLEKERSAKFREELTSLVKASGQEVIDRAEDLVGNGDLISDFEIRLVFPIDEFPTIKVVRQHLIKNVKDVFCKERSF